MNVLGASVVAQALMIAVTLLSALGPIRFEELAPPPSTVRRLS